MFKKKIIQPIEEPQETEKTTQSLTITHKKIVGKLEVELTIVDDRLTEVVFDSVPDFTTRGFHYHSMYDSKRFTGAQYNDLIALLEWAKSTIPEFTGVEEKS